MPQCPKCKTTFESKESAKQAVRPSLLTINRPEMSSDFIGAVHTPRAHASDFCGTASVLSVGLAGLLGASWEQCFYAGLMTGAAVFGVVRAMGTFQDNNRWHLRYELEELTGIDLDGDGVVGDPEKQTDPPPTKAPDVIVKSGVTGNVRIKHTIPFTNHKEARNLARAVLLWGVPFSRRKLTDTNVIPDDPDHYSAVYQAMVKAELVKKSGSKNVLTSAGEQYLRKCLTPLPEEQ